MLNEWPFWPLEDVEARALLWADTRSEQFPSANAARVLAAIVDVLDRERPLGDAADEFLELHATASNAPGSARPALWSDPGAYTWTRNTHRLVKSAVVGAGRDDTTCGQLQRHLERFKEYALGSACAVGGSIRFRTPLRVETPFAIPATPWLLDGADTVEIHGIAGDALVIDIDGCEVLVSLAISGGESAQGPVRTRRCAVARVSGHEWLVHPAALAREGWDKAEAACSMRDAYQADHLDLVETAIRSMARFAPQFFEHFCRSIKVFALKPRDRGGFEDFSEPALPGSFVASTIASPWELADHFIHELQHNRLSFIEECGPLFQDANSTTRYYSPWRDDARSLYGVFHGVYVFLGVFSYWRSVYSTAGIDSAVRSYALDRVIRLPLQLELARRLLERHARLAPLGRVLLDQLVRDVDELREAGARDRIPPDAPAFVAADDGAYIPETSRIDGRPMTVREALAEHACHHEAASQCEGLLDDLVLNASDAAR